MILWPEEGLLDEAFDTFIYWRSSLDNRDLAEPFVRKSRSSRDCRRDLYIFLSVQYGPQSSFSYHSTFTIVASCYYYPLRRTLLCLNPLIVPREASYVLGIVSLLFCSNMRTAKIYTNNSILVAFLRRKTKCYIGTQPKRVKFIRWWYIYPNEHLYRNLRFFSSRTMSMQAKHQMAFVVTWSVDMDGW